MDFFGNYKSLFGYENGENGGVDSYGVDHSGFSTQDELQYQTARANREEELRKNFEKQGITQENYPQYSNNFWGNSDNNYGFGTSNIAQNVQNHPAMDMTNETAHNPNYISDNDLYQRMWGNIKKFEDVVPYPYLDTKGNITVGGGANINNFNDFMKVNFLENNIAANNTQKVLGYDVLHNMSQRTDANGNYLYANTQSKFFEPATNLRITDDEAYRLAQNHMKNDLAHVRKEFVDFDGLPTSLKEVLLDIQYNTGGLNKQNWPNLYKAINNQDVNGIVNNVHRKGIGKDRNEWAEKLSNSIRF